MELKYPIILKIGIPALVIAGVLFHLIKRKVAFRGGIRAANTEFVRELPEYRSYHIKQIALRCILEVTEQRREISILTSMYHIRFVT